MNYRFFQSNRCLFFSFLFLCSYALHAQDTGPAPLDSLPNPDSLGSAVLGDWAGKLWKQARDIEQIFNDRAAQADQERVSREDNLNLAKKDTTTPKETIVALEKDLKSALGRKKVADKNLKQASQTAAFAAKVADMDSLGRRKNLRKVWKQVQELDAVLHPPVEKPIAEVLQNPPPAAAVDSAALAEKTKPKEKKPEKPAPKYKPFDPGADVLLNPPKRPCALAVSTRDEFSGETYRETQREELFRFTNEVLKKILPPGQPHMVCEAALSASGLKTSLLLTFTINDPGARKAFGSLAKNSTATLKFLDGDTFILTNTRNDDGVRDESGQVYTYRAQYPVDAAFVKKMRKTELDKVRIAWSTGYEDYEIQGIDVLIREGKCLGE